MIRLKCNPEIRCGWLCGRFVFVLLWKMNIRLSLHLFSAKSVMFVSIMFNTEAEDFSNGSPRLINWPIKWTFCIQFTILLSFSVLSLLSVACYRIVGAYFWTCHSRWIENFNDNVYSLLLFGVILSLIKILNNNNNTKKIESTDRKAKKSNIFFPP